MASVESFSTPEDKGSEYLVIMRMGDANCVHHLIPIVRSPEVLCVHLVRPEPRPPGLPENGLRYVQVRGRTRVAQVLRTLLSAIRVARRPEVRGMISFNGVPYGIIAILAGFVARKPVHIGFVGTEAHDLERKRSRRLLDRMLRRATLITVPGPTMGEALVRRNYDPARIHVLPHSIDTESFKPPTAGFNRDIDVLFVGALIARKQIDHILAALPAVVSSRGRTQLCIVGDGPLRQPLEEQVKELGLRGSVEFAGYQTNPAGWFRRARAIVIASWWEGFPFVLVEAMSTGAVPVATRVGSIPDIIEHDRNGVLLDSDRPEAIAAALLELLDDEQREERLRGGALRSRDRFGYESATAVWDELLSRM